MTIQAEIEALHEHLCALKQQGNQLFAAQIELRIQLSLLVDDLEELDFKNQYLAAMSNILTATKEDP